MVGVGGITGAILAISYRLQSDIQLSFFSILLIAGFVGYARLKLNAHTPAQVYTGFLVGFLIQMGLIVFY
jgi:membrane-associated phospholipid phosphatase